jgi:hypothetical protein
MIQKNIKTYKNIPGLRAAGVDLEYTEEEVQEFIKCMDDPMYFMENYITIINANGKKQKFILRDYQKRMLKLLVEERMVIGCLSRQVGKSLLCSIYLLWCALFHDDFNILIAANKSNTAKEIVGKVKVACQNLPYFLQKGITEWNTMSIAFENGSKISGTATTENTGRGSAIQILLLDEFAFVNENIAKEFLASVYPTISGGTETKVFVISTPNGLNHYHKMWVNALKQESSFKYFTIKWDEVPGRDEEFKRKTIADIGLATWEQEYELKFLGNANSLISAAALEALSFYEPIEDHDGIRFFKKPMEDHYYFISVDTSRGKGLDSSAFCVLDITQYPFEVVATYNSEWQAPQLYASYVLNAAKIYNEAMVLIELNDLGQQVSDTLIDDLEYTNVLYTENNGRAGRILNEGVGDPGIPTAPSTRRLGCANLKSLVEGKQMIINDYDVIAELSNFGLVNGKYQALPGQHDDYVMCLVLFSWAVNQEYFKELMNMDVRKKLFSEKAQRIEEDLVPFGSIDSGHEDPDYLPGGWQVTNSKLY